MFRVINTETDGNLISEHHYNINDAKDVRDLIIGITGDEIEADRVYAVIGEMKWNDEFKSGVYKYIIRCFRE